MLCELYIFWKFFENSYKTINESISWSVVGFLFEEHTKGNGHSKGTRALEGHSRHLDTQDTLFSTLSSAITRVAWHHRTSLIMSHDFYFDRIYWHQDCCKGNNIAINSDGFFHCCYKSIFSFYLLTYLLTGRFLSVFHS